MKDIGELLREADPLQHEPTVSPAELNLRRREVIAAASNAQTRPELPSRIAVLAAAALLLIVVSFLGERIGSPFIGEVHAAVRFEVRLVEDRPGRGLHEAKISGSDRPIYLHDEIVVSNSDISTAKVIQGATPSQYWVSVEFNQAGAEKMRRATEGHVGKMMAILLDGQVVMVPVIRSPVGAAAMISGDFTKTQAEKIRSGITAP